MALVWRPSSGWFGNRNRTRWRRAPSKPASVVRYAVPPALAIVRVLKHYVQLPVRGRNSRMRTRTWVRIRLIRNRAHRGIAGIAVLTLLGGPVGFAIRVTPSRVIGVGRKVNQWRPPPRFSGDCNQEPCAHRVHKAGDSHRERNLVTASIRIVGRAG